MRERAAQELNPKMGRMGAEDPSRGFRPSLYVLGTSAWTCSIQRRWKKKEMA
jgi:hypothetical protein